LGILAVTALGATAPLAAQARSTVSGTEIESAVLAAPASNQEAVQHFLQNDRVTETANGMGVRTEDLAAGIGRLDAASLSQLAERTRAAERDLAGGSSTVVISTTAIIIILLVLILVTR
jgi:hypothetical protein